MSLPQPTPASQVVTRSLAELATPTLLLDYDIAMSNIRQMAAEFNGPTALRPHIKAHKCPELAHLQVAAGAQGITTASVWEAQAMIEAGLTDVLIANEVVDPLKIEVLANIARSCQVTVGVDDGDNVRALSRAAHDARSEIGVLIDIDIGLGRCGARSIREATALAELTESLTNVRLEGVMGYEGHCFFERDRERRAQCARVAIAQLVETADAFVALGLPPQTVSAGGTITFDITGRNERVTEVQAGSYVLMDTAHEAAASGFRPALTLLASVLSRHGETLVIDAGRKTCGAEISPPRLLGYEGTFRYEAEEHAVFAVPRECSLRPGDRVRLVTGYCPVTTNLHPFFHVVKQDEIIDRWAIVARGPGWASP